MATIFMTEKVFKPPLLLFKTLLATAVFQITLLPLYILDFVYYNPLITLSDIFSNYLFILLLTTLFKNVALPLCLLYFIYGGGVTLYYFTKRNLSFSDIANVPELFMSYPTYAVAAIILVTLLVYFILFTTSKKAHFFSIGEVKPLPVTRFLLVSIAIFTILFSYLQPGVPFLLIAGKNVESFNKGASWKHGGQIYSIYYAALEDRINARKIDSHVIQDSAFHLKPFKPSKTPNVYFIVLESFRPIHSLDIEIVERIAAKVDINRLVRFNYVGVSPVFGGGSAAAEFELLCGVPELNVLGNLTFNYLGGVNAGLCLPAILENLGYGTIAVTGTKPHFHNASSAYTALGFSTFYSKQHIETSDYDGVHPSDNSIYKTILRIMGNQHGPMFYYLFTAAGHSPYALNEVSRPPIVSGLNESQYINRVLHSHLELSSFIELIREQQPDSLLIVVGDHNTVSGKAISSAARIHPMRVPVYISGENSEDELTVIPYFNIPRLIMANLSGKAEIRSESDIPLYFRDEIEIETYVRQHKADAVASNFNIIKRSQRELLR